MRWQVTTGSFCEMYSPRLGLPGDNRGNAMASEVAKRSSDKSEKPATEKLEKVPAPGPDVVPTFNPLLELTKRQAWLLGGLILLANIPLIHYGVRHVLMEMPVTTTIPFQDDFSRAELGPNYWTTGGLWRIEGGELHFPGVKDNPLWLQAKLPNDVGIDFDVRSMNAEGDIRFEMYGDGLNPGSGYRFIFGGMNNQLTAIAKLDDHWPAFDANEVGMAAGGGENQSLVAGHTLDELSRTGVLGRARLGASSGSTSASSRRTCTTCTSIEKAARSAGTSTTSSRCT